MVLAISIPVFFNEFTWSFIKAIKGEITIVRGFNSLYFSEIYIDGSWNITDFPEPVDEVIKMSL